MTELNPAMRTIAEKTDFSQKQQTTAKDTETQLTENKMANDYFSSQCIWNNKNESYQNKYTESTIRQDRCSKQKENNQKACMEETCIASQIADKILKDTSVKIPSIYNDDSFKDDVFTQTLTKPDNQTRAAEQDKHNSKTAQKGFEKFEPPAIDYTA